LIAFGIVSHIWLDTVLAWLCYVAAFISILLYFMFGTMRLVQDAITEGDVDSAKKYMSMIRFPRLLFKPIRQAYYLLEGNLAMVDNDMDKAEANIRKGISAQSKLVGDTRGAGLLQLGFIQLRKGNIKEGRLNLMEAIKAGIPDKEQLAAAYLQLCSIEIQRQQYRIAKEYYRKSKACKPTSSEILEQFRIMDKQIPRLPG
jgi:tetratricopeptide (TPR) repeat protein